VRCGVFFSDAFPTCRATSLRPPKLENGPAHFPLDWFHQSFDGINPTITLKRLDVLYPFPHSFIYTIFLSCPTPHRDHGSSIPSPARNVQLLSRNRPGTSAGSAKHL